MDSKIIKFNADFEATVKFPNVGQLMDIESMKMALTNGQYALMIESGTQLATFQLDIADAVSYLSVLVPDLKKEYGVKNWGALEAKQGKQLVNIYKKQFLPWFKPMMDELTKVDTDESSESENPEGDNS